MKIRLFIPQLNQEIEFDFMMMQYDEDLAYIDGELRATFLLRSNSETNPNLLLGVHFNIDDFTDERFEDYVYTGLKSLHKIELYDFDLNIILNDNQRDTILQIATTMFSRDYKELTLKN